jgi:hypothetical protein
MMRQFLIGAVALSALGSCATLDEGECRAGDWNGIGFRDGESGYPQSRLGDHAEACAKFSIPPDARAYAAGRDEGLRLYCTPQRGFHAARQGQSYASVCPPGAEAAFLAGFGDGQLVHGVASRRQQARSDRDAAEARAKRLEGEIAAEDAKATDSKLSEKDRNAARSRARSLRDDRARALDDVPRYERVEREEAREYDRLRANFTANYGPY